MRRTALLLCLALTAWAQSDVIVIRGARVVDGTGSAARNLTVVIRGSRIETVSTDAAAPAGARIIDAAGQTLIPGLFDLHTHLTASAANGVSGDWGKNLKAYLACGITTVNDYSTSAEMIAPMHRLLDNGTVLGPHVNMAIRLSTPGGHGTEAGWGDFMTYVAATPEQAHSQMRSVLAYRPDVIKVFTDGWRYGSAPDLSSMNEETLAAIVSDAHSAKIKVFTHTVTLAGAKIAARAGVDVLVHGIGDAPVDAELIGLLKAHGTFYVSTLAVYESHQLGNLSERVLALLDPASREATARAAAPRTAPAAPNEARQRRWQNLLANVHRLNEAGVPVAAGTDAGMAGTFHGFAALHELELLVEAGMTPLQAISAGTTMSARALGVEDQRGAIAPGKVADLVLIDGRPDEKIADIEKTRRVFLNGMEFDPRKLEAAIQAPAQTVLPARRVAALIDDMERTDGHTQIGTLRVNGTDAGVDHSTMMFQPIVRAGGDHALMVQAQMAAKDRPFVRMEFPLTPGAVELADLTQFTGLSFDARGEGAYRLIVNSYGVRAPDPYLAPFSVTGEWQTVRIPFASLQRRAADAGAWTRNDARSLLFELSAAAGAGAWLELDNVKLY
ncbi:MAG TPA: amidohydrolase family protein [Candidatus Sulfopaludibacter sp.]|jgi:imidazolonepropionase-like amidohydrolase|nr:amidohydrolase family protein [Candidatus Sulfopaludibacter sp.]